VYVEGENPRMLWHWSQSTARPAMVAVRLCTSAWQAPQVAKGGFRVLGVAKSW
jgi:hypothetical protein